MLIIQLPVSVMLKSIRRTFSLKFRNHLFVCLHKDRMPAALRERVQPRVFLCFACWVDNLSPDKAV